jgi:IPT/TIG domain
MDLRTSLLCVALVGVAGSLTIADKTQTVIGLRIPDETVPAGGVVQMKVERYEVTPISGGRPSVGYDESLFDSFMGFGMFAPTGELAGVAVIDGNRANISYVTTRTAPGDLPLLTVALRARPDAVAGSHGSFSLDSSSTWTLNGVNLLTRVDPATITVGGTLSISSVVPGQGSFPPGTVVSVRGMGFDSGTRLRVEDTAITSVRVVSPTEMRFTLVEPTNITGKRLRADNPDGSRVYYFAYTRGVPAAVSTRPLLARTVPIFSGTQ